MYLKFERKWKFVLQYCMPCIPNFWNFQSSVVWAKIAAVQLQELARIMFLKNGLATFSHTIQELAKCFCKFLILTNYKNFSTRNKNIHISPHIHIVKTFPGFSIKNPAYAADALEYYWLLLKHALMNLKIFRVDWTLHTKETKHRPSQKWQTFLNRSDSCWKCLRYLNRRN